MTEEWATGPRSPIDVAGFGRMAASGEAEELPQFRWGPQASTPPPPGPPPGYERTGFGIDPRHPVGYPAAPRTLPPEPLPERPVPRFSTGPPGEGRSALAVALLNLVSLGLYQIIWHARANREMREYDPGMTVHPRRSATAIAVVWVVGLVVSAAGAARVIVHQANISLSFDPRLTPDQGLYLIPSVLAVPLLQLVVPISLIALVMTFERLRMVEAIAGVEPGDQVVPARMVWWMLVPLLGAAIAVGRAQSRLNTCWERVRAHTEASWGFGYGG